MLTGRKLALTLAFTVLVALAFGVSCKGFFPPNTLNSIAIQPPSVNLEVNATQQFTAYGTYQDGTRSPITSGLVWTSSDSQSVPITSGGLATGASVTTSSVTITGSAEGLSGTGTVTVIGNVTTIAVSPTSASIAPGNSVTFTFTASPGPPSYVTANNGGTLTISPVDSFFNCTPGTDKNGNPAEVCTLSQGTTAPSYTIQMSYPSPSGGTVFSLPIVTVTVT